MKKILALILCITMFAGIMTSCGKGDGNEQATTTENKTEVLAPDVWNGDVASSFEKGSGSESDPYVIATSAQLAYLAQQVNAGVDYTDKYIQLNRDLDLGDIEWTPIGNGKNSFSGNFNGNGYSISNIKITTPTKYVLQNSITEEDMPEGYAALFGTCKNVFIKNLIIDDASIKVKTSSELDNLYIASLVAKLESDTYCHFENIKAKDIKLSTEADSNNETASLSILAAGGLIGHLTNGTSNCIISKIEVDSFISIEEVFGNSDACGGIIGIVANKKNIDCSYISSYMSTRLPDISNVLYEQRKFVGAIGAISRNDEKINISEVFSEIKVNKKSSDTYSDIYQLRSIKSNSVIGNVYKYSGTIEFSDIYGCVKPIDTSADFDAPIETLYELPENCVHTETNCKGCTSLPYNHGLDTNIWDISSLEQPKLK